MDIGKPIRTITIEPAVIPVPQRERQEPQRTPDTPRPARPPVPRKEPAEKPVRPVKVPEKVPS